MIKGEFDLHEITIRDKLRVNGSSRPINGSCLIERQTSFRTLWSLINKGNAEGYILPSYIVPVSAAAPKLYQTLFAADRCENVAPSHWIP